MPWTGQEYRSRHNKRLSSAQAGKAARMANAMLKEGVPEGEAIATANARVDPGARKADAAPRRYGRVHRDRIKNTARED